MNLMHYLLEANLYLAAFWLLYVLFLRRETLYQLNRAYLLVSSVLAYIIPLLQLGILKPSAYGFVTLGDMNVGHVEGTAETLPTDAAPVVQHFSLADYGLMLYAAVAITLLMLLIFKIAKLIKMAKKGIAIKKDGFTLVELPAENTAFSFFGYLFINKQLASSATILCHEEVHIRQRHSWDIVYLELLKIINWFNPVVYLLQKSLREVHEFIADEQASAIENGPSDYADFLISNAYGLPKTMLINSFFNKNLLKRRIMMLYQKRSGKAARLKYLLVLPLFGGLVCASTLAFTKDYGWIDIAPKNLPVAKPINMIKPASNYIQPSFPGGAKAYYKFLRENINWSKIKSDDNFKYILTGFAVEKDGTLSKVKVTGAMGKAIAVEVKTEMERVLLKSPKWVPGTRNGEPIRLWQAILLNIQGEAISFASPSNSAGAPIVPNQNVGNTFIKMQAGLAPSFPGGQVAFYKFLSDNIKYPKAAKDANVEGKVFVSFTVEKDGTLKDIRFLRDPGYGFAEEALRVIKLSPKWIPGVKDGEKISVQYTLPVTFSLSINKATKPIIPQINNNEPSVNGQPVYNAVEVNPEFPGGDAAFNEYLRKNVHYPKEAREKGVQGRVFIQFTVEADGSLTDMKALRDPGSGLAEEAIRVLSASPKWIPGKQKGEPVRVQYTVPVNFSMVDDVVIRGNELELNKFVATHVRYSADARARNIQGRVFVSFTIGDNQKIENIEVLRSPDKLLSDEVVRVLSTFRLTDGKPNVSYVLPVNFLINIGNDKYETKAPENAQPVANKAKVSYPQRLSLHEVVVVTYKSTENK